MHLKIVVLVLCARERERKKRERARERRERDRGGKGLEEEEEELLELLLRIERSFVFPMEYNFFNVVVNLSMCPRGSERTRYLGYHCKTCT